MRIRLNDLAPGVPYVLRLRSTDGETYSQWSRAFDLLTSSDTVAPKVPASVTGSMTGTSFNLSWAAVTQSADNSNAYDLDHYEVLVASGGTGVTKVYNVTDTKFQFTFEMNRELFGTPRANIIMSVLARDKTGNPSAYSTAVNQTNPAPATPTGLSAVTSVDTVTLTWAANTEGDLKGYGIWLSKTGVGGTYNYLGATTGNTFTSTTTDYFTDHYYRITAYDVFDTQSTPTTPVGPVRPVGSFVLDSTPPAVPTGLAATITTLPNYSGASMAVSWAAVTDTAGDLAGYRIGYRPVGASDWQYTDVDYTNTSTLIDKLTALVNYEVRIRSYDFMANFSNWSSTVTTSTAATSSTPSTPAAPSVAASTLKVQVTVSGLKAAGGAMEGDVVHYDVHASGANGFTATASNLIGTIRAGATMVQDFYIPATAASGTTGTIYFRIVAVNSGGLKSAASAQTTSSLTLMTTANIGDAVITNAKIGTVDVNKLTAGSGFINDLIVKSKFTLGDATTDGIIESYDYGTSGGTTGFRLAKSGLIIKSGLIEAAALRLQNSPNLVPAAYADFEYSKAFYIDPFWFGGGQSQVHVTNAIAEPFTGPSTSLFKGKQFLSISMPFNNDPLSAWFGNSPTDYNISVEPGKTYIWSCYIRNAGSAAETLNILFKGDNGTVFQTTPFSLGASEADKVRRTVAVTIPAGVNKIVIGIEKPTNTGAFGSFHFDGQQFEEKTGTDNTPSVWKPPGATVLDGAGITTGYLRSNSIINVSGTDLPTWSLNTGGSMQVGDALIRGKLVVGTVSESPVNRAPNNGDFESNATGYQVYASGATGTAIARTTTAGEVITGTGSIKTTAAAGTKTRLGVAFNTSAYTEGTRLTLRAKVKVNVTDASSFIRVAVWDSALTVLDFQDVIINPTANTVYDIEYQYSMDVGQTANLITIGHAGNAITSTAFIADDIVLNDNLFVGNSYISSPDYQPGASGYRIDSTGNAEFNNGTFRGRLGANMVDAEQMVSEIVMSSAFKTAKTGRRVEFDGTGVSLFDTDESLLVNLPTNTDGPASFNGDLLATSLTVSDQLAIRGTNNELSKGATITLSSGTTEPTSPPTVQVGYEQIATPTDTTWAPYRRGLAWSPINSRFIMVQDIYGANAFLAYYNTSGQQDYTTTTLKDVRVEGSVMVFGGEIYILGKDINGVWKVEVRNETTKAWVRTWAPNNGYAYRAAIGNDGASVFIIYGANSDHRIWMTKFNKTTGAIVSSWSSDHYMSGGNYHISGAGYVPASTSGGFAAARYWWTRDNEKTVWVADASLQSLASATLGETFTSPNNIRGCVFADAGEGNRFYTYDYASGKITKHTGASWQGTAANSSKWWVASTWYDPNGTGGTHETKIGKMTSFTMTKRAALTITSPPLPLRPVPNTNDDVRQAGIYMARNSATPTSAMMERQGYTANESRIFYLHRNGGPVTVLPTAGAAATNAPPTSNGFLGLAGVAPAEIRSNDDRIQLYGDGTFILGDAKLNSSTYSNGTYVIHDSRQYTLSLATGWAVYSTGYATPRAYRTADGLWILTGLVKRTGANIAVTGGTIMGTIPSFAAAQPQIGAALATNNVTGTFCGQVDGNGDVKIRSTGPSLTIVTGDWFSLNGIVVHGSAN